MEQRRVMLIPYIYNCGSEYRSRKILIKNHYTKELTIITVAIVSITKEDIKKTARINTPGFVHTISTN